MNDFASAAMLRLLHAGMRKLGLRSPVKQWLTQATVPLDAKQQLVARVLNERGISALLQLGQGLHDMQHDSLMPMLIHPGQPLRVLKSWLRLERYLHSRHRISQEIVGQLEVRHSHFSIKAGSVPSAAEDLVVVGVLIALLQKAGCEHLSIKLKDSSLLWPWRATSKQEDDLRNAFVNELTHEWSISWEGVGASEKDIASVQSHIDVGSSTSLSAHVQRLASQTLGETLSLDAAAKLLLCSRRSLQRKLSLEGTRYVDIIASARAERASQLLSHSKADLAEIGFLCGYSDQAHFCRDFKRRVGMSPLRYREYSLE